MFLPENPRGSGAWWAAVYGVIHSRTRLKRLSSSSMPDSDNAIRKMRHGNGQRIMAVTESAILAWVSRESFSEKVKTEQESE